MVQSTNIVEIQSCVEMADRETPTERIEELRDETSLSQREAEVRAWMEEGLSQEQIADELDIDKSTVGSYASRMNAKLDEAYSTYKKVEVENIAVRCLGCGANVEDGPVLADWPVCEPCFRTLWRDWFDTETDIDLSRERIDDMLDRRVTLLAEINERLIEAQAKNISEER